jgi:REP-associated tyrosine transposase
LFLSVAETGGVIPAIGCFAYRESGSNRIESESASPLHFDLGMARPLRIEFPGAIYHVMSRGNAKQDIYLDDHDRRRFLETLWEVCERSDWQVWAYCLMPNHYHLLLQTALPNLSRGMHDLNGSYSIAFNGRHQRVGHLFQGRFRALLVDRDGYFFELSRYIVLNPVRSGLCDRPEGWRWSSYRATAGLAAAPPRLAAGTVLDGFGPNRREALPEFIQFVTAGLAAADPAVAQRIPTIVGDDAFVAGIAHAVDEPSLEVPKAERALKPLEVYARQATSRNDAVRTAYASGAYTQVAIARHFGLHYTTVCRILDNSGCRDAKKQDLTP